MKLTGNVACTLLNPPFFYKVLWQAPRRACAVDVAQAALWCGSYIRLSHGHDNAPRLFPDLQSFISKPQAFVFTYKRAHEVHVFNIISSREWNEIVIQVSFLQARLRRKVQRS